MSSTADPNANPRRRSRWPLLLFGLALLLGLLVAALPYAVQWFLNDWLRDRGVVNVSIEDIDINPFLGVFEIESLEFEDASGLHRAGLARIDLSWAELLNDRILLTRVELRDATLRIRRTDSNRWLLGTIVLGASEAVEEAEQLEAEAGLGFGILELQIDNVTVDYRDPIIEREVTVDSLTITDFATWQPEQITALELQLSAGSQTLSVSGEAQPLAARPTFDATLALSDLTAAGLSELLAPAGVERIEGLLDADLDIELGIDPGAAETTVAIEGSVRLAELNLVRQSERYALESLGWDGSADLNLAAEHNRLTLRGELDIAALRLMLGEQTLSLAESSWDGVTTIDLAGMGTAVDFDGAFDAEDLNIGSPDAGVVATIGALGIEALGSTSSEQGWPLRTDAELTLEAVAAGTPQWPDLLQIARVDAQLRPPDSDRLLIVESLALRQVALVARADPAAGSAEQLIGLAAVNVEDISVASAELSTGEIELVDLGVWLQRNQDGSLELDSLLARLQPPQLDSPLQAEEAPAAPAPAAEVSAAAMNFSIAGVRTSGDSRLVYVDESVRPVVRLELKPLELELGAIDSAQPGRVTPVEVKASQGRYGSLAFTGELKPLATVNHVQGSGRIRDLDMVALNGFARRTLGYRITAGSMSADIEVSLEGQNLDSAADLTLRRLQIDPLKKHEQDEFTTELGVPLGTALGLLEDDDETIRLTIPLEGELSQLSVGVGDAIRLVVQKGLMAGLQTAATTYFAPLWPALAATRLFAVAMQLDFEDITFAAGESGLDAEQREYVRNMAVLLAKRDDVSLSLCGRAVAADVARQFPDLGAELTAEQTSALEVLAERRHQAVKDQLIAEGIAGDRLVTCAPHARPADNGAPRVDFSS